MKDPETPLKRITIDSGVLVGKPCIRGMRISVEQILEGLAAGISQEKILEEYPVLESEDLRAVLLYAKELVALERVYPGCSRRAIARKAAPKRLGRPSPRSAFQPDRRAQA